MYKGGFKYQLVGTYTVELPKISIETPIITEYIWLHKSRLVIKTGYAWDGPSGIAIDTKNFMRGSLIHDVFYQLIREGHLDNSYRKVADEILKDICLEDNMSKIRAWWVYFGVRLFAGFAAKTKNIRKVEKAP